MKLCLYCADLISGDGLGCAACGRAAMPQYEQLVRIATDYAGYGVLYRSGYELQLEQNGRIIENYALVPSDWLIFASIAALSGIIGNVSYDVVRVVIKKIILQSPESKFLNPRDKIDPNSELDIQRLIRYLEDYHKGLPTVHPTVRNAIAEERAIAQSLAGMQDVVHLIYGERRNLSGDDIARLTADARRRYAEDLQLPLPLDFEELWCNVDEDQE